MKKNKSKRFTRKKIKLYNKVRSDEKVSITAHKQVSFNFSGITIIADVEVEDDVVMNAPNGSFFDTWITFYPIISKGEETFKMDRFHFIVDEDKTIEEHLLETVAFELYRTYDFIDEYPYVEDYQKTIDGRLYNSGVYDRYVGYCNDCLKLRDFITKDWIDSILVMQKLEE